MGQDKQTEETTGAEGATAIGGPSAVPGYGAWHPLDDLPMIQAPECRSDDLLGCWDNGRMGTVYFDGVDMQWKDAEEGLPVTTIKDHHEHWHTVLAHWCELPPAP